MVTVTNKSSKIDERAALKVKVQIEVTVENLNCTELLAARIYRDALAHSIAQNLAEHGHQPAEDLLAQYRAARRYVHDLTGTRRDV